MNFEKFIKSIDEEYLIGVSNKGTVKRAAKDLEKVSEIKYEINDQDIEFILDDIKCTVSNEVQKYKCSCPSRSICKHVIMCYLYLIENASEVFGTDEDACSDTCINKSAADINETSQEQSLSLAEENEVLKEYSLDKIKKAIGERNLIGIIRKIHFGLDYSITEKSFVTVAIKDEDVTVRLFNEIDNSVCSCRSREFCIHKGEAVILYRLYKGTLTMKELNEYEVSKVRIDYEVIKKAGKEIRKVIEDILISGLARESAGITESINNMAIKCHNYDMPNFEKNLRSIKEEMLLYMKKHSSFEKKHLLGRITSLYAKTIALEKTDNINQMTELIGEFKTSYYEIPIIELHGIGEEEWQSKSGYKGTTFYFFENTRQKIFTYTNSSAVFYDNSSSWSEKVKKSVPWNLNCRADEVGKVHFKLVYGRINSQNRISKSRDSKGMIIDSTDILSLNIEKYTYDDWNRIIEEVFSEKKYKYENYNAVFIQGAEFKENSFDEITQTFNLQIYDKNKKVIHIDMKFSMENKPKIRRLEKLAKEGRVPLFFGSVYISDARLMFYPISFSTDKGEVINIFQQ